MVPSADPILPTVTQHAVLVGVTHSQPESVVRQAGKLARLVDASLVCVHVDTTVLATSLYPDGGLGSVPAQTGFDEVPSFDRELAERIESVLSEHPPARIEYVELTGSPAEALAEIATASQARYIVVGARKPGLSSTIGEFFNGSVAARLAHIQPAPVLVVPSKPLGALPWDDLPD